MITLKSYLIALEKGNLNEIDLEILRENFHRYCKRVADHFQFNLHQFCKRDLVNSKDADIVAELSRLCFSKEALSAYSNMHRFLGCSYHISTYLLKRKLYTTALDILKAVLVRSKDITLAAKDNALIKNILYSFHSQFIISAQTLAENCKSSSDKNIELSCDLAQNSMSIMILIGQPDNELSMKVLRNMKYYLKGVKFVKSKHFKNIYKSFLSAMDCLSESFQKSELLNYFALKMNSVVISKDMTEGEAAEFNTCFKRTAQLLLLFMDDAEDLKAWDMIIDFFIGPVKKNEFKSLLQAMDTVLRHGTTYLSFLSVICSIGVQSWWKLHADDWPDKISADFVQKLFDNVIVRLITLQQNMPLSCTSGSATNDFCFSEILPKPLINIFYTIRLCLKNEIDDALELVEVSHKAFSLAQQYFKKCENKCCSQNKKSLWYHLVIHFTNTTEDILKFSKDSRSWTYLARSCQELLFEVVKSDLELPYEQSRVQLLFHRWHYATMKLKQYEEALFVCAFQLVAYPDDRDEVFSAWAETKVDVAQENLANLTILDVLERNESRLKEINTNFGTSNIDKKSFLIMELESYVFGTSSSLGQPISRTWELLGRMKLNPYEAAHVLNCVVSGTIESVNNETIEVYKKKCNRVIATLKSNKQPRSLVYTGNLKYSLFLCDLKSVQKTEDHSEARASILDFLMKEEEEKVKFGDAVDLNLTCNVMPTSSQLNLLLEEGFVNALKESVDLWEKASERIAKKNLDSREIESWLSNVKKAGYMFELLGHASEALAVWILLFQLGDVLENKVTQLLAITRIVEASSNLIDSGLVELGDSIVEEVATEKKEKEMSIRFWLSVAGYYLRRQEPDKCAEYLLKVKTALEALRSYVKSCLFKARFFSLASQLICISDKFKTNLGFDKDYNLSNIVFRAYENVKSGTSYELVGTEHAEMILTMLKVNVWAFRFFGIYYQTGFMRLFLDGLYQIVQKLAFPSRIAQILVYLAEVDITTKKLDDCQVKVDKLKSILMINSKNVPRVTVKVEVENQEWETGGLERNLLQVPRSEMNVSPCTLSPARFLNTRDSSRETDLSPCRYYLQDEEDLLEEHPSQCRCYVCQNILVRMLNIGCFAAEAQLHTVRGSYTKAYSYYKHAYSCLKNLENYRFELSLAMSGKLKNGCRIPAQMDLEFERDSVDFESAKFLMSFAMFEMLPDLNKDTTDIVQWRIAKISNILPRLAHEKRILNYRFIELRICALEIAKMRQNESRKKVSPVMMSSSHTSSVIKADTPRVTQSRTPVIQGVARNKNLSKSPVNYGRKQRGRRILMNDPEEEEEDEQDSSEAKAVVPKTVKKKLNTELPKNVLKTPAVLKTKASTIKIFESSDDNYFFQEDLKTVKKKPLTRAAKLATRSNQQNGKK